jgi:hypothetical protein
MKRLLLPSPLVLQPANATPHVRRHPLSGHRPSLLARAEEVIE